MQKFFFGIFFVQVYNRFPPCCFRKLPYIFAEFKKFSAEKFWFFPIVRHIRALFFVAFYYARNTYQTVKIEKDNQIGGGKPQFHRAVKIAVDNPLFSADNFLLTRNSLFFRSHNHIRSPMFLIQMKQRITRYFGNAFRRPAFAAAAIAHKNNFIVFFEIKAHLILHAAVRAEPAVHRYDHAVDKSRRFRAAQPQQRPNQFFRLAETPHWRGR